MKSETSEYFIVPVAEGFLKIPMIHKGVFLKIKCYYSQEFTSTLLSDDYNFEVLPMQEDYCGELILKFFKQTEIKELPIKEKRPN